MYQFAVRAHVPVREEQLQERLGGRYRRLDVPMLAEWDDGRRDAILFSIEEESDRHRFSPHQPAHCCLDLAGMSGSERRGYLIFDYLACALGDMPAERLTGQRQRGGACGSAEHAPARGPRQGRRPRKRRGRLPGPGADSDRRAAAGPSGSPAGSSVAIRHRARSVFAKEGRFRHRARLRVTPPSRD